MRDNREVKKKRGMFSGILRLKIASLNFLKEYIYFFKESYWQKIADKLMSHFLVQINYLNTMRPLDNIRISFPRLSLPFILATGPLESDKPFHRSPPSLAIVLLRATIRERIPALSGGKLSRLFKRFFFTAHALFVGRRDRQPRR